jgi:hypothetical protein
MSPAELAKLIEQILKNRRSLIVATAVSSLYPDTAGTFSVAGSGELITARALNFCTGECLLALVDNSWVAIASAGNGAIVTSRIDRQIWRRPKLDPRTPREPKFIGINTFNIPRKLVDDFDADLTALFATLTPSVNPIYYELNVDNTTGTSEADLDDTYWRVTGFDGNLNGIFFAIDKLNVKHRYPIGYDIFVDVGNKVEYLGNGSYLGLVTSDYTTSSFEPFWAQQQTKMRIYGVSGVQTSSFSQIAIPLIPPTGIVDYANPVPPTYNCDRHAKLSLGNYFRYGSRGGAIQYSDINMSLGSYAGQTISGKLTIDYGGLNGSQDGAYSQRLATDYMYLPVTFGQKTLTMTIAQLALPIKTISDLRRIGVSDAAEYADTVGLQNTTLVYSHITDFQQIPTVKYELDGLELKLNNTGQANGGRDRLFQSILSIVGNYNPILVGANRIEFTGYQPLFAASQYDISITKIYDINTGLTTTSRIVAPHPHYQTLETARMAIVTDRIRNVRFNAIDVTPVTINFVDNSRLDAANFNIIDDLPNPTSFRGVVWIDVGLFDPRFTTILNSDDCYAKIFRTYQPSSFSSTGKIWALEFWVLADGEIRLYDIHEREENADAIDARARIYYAEFDLE